MLGKPVEFELLKKNINEDDIENAISILELNKYKFTFWNELIKRKDILNNDKFETMRYYYLHISRYLKKLNIPYINMVYYKKLNDEIPSHQKMFKPVESSSYEELYFYYFFIMIDSVFNAINKLLVLVSDSFELDVDNKSNSNFETNILKELKNSSNLYQINEIQKLVNYLSNYKGSIYEICKNEYRNNHIHDFTKDIPKFRIIDNNIYFEKSLNKDKSFEDCIKLLKELGSLIRIIDESIISYLNCYFPMI